MNEDFDDDTESYSMKICHRADYNGYEVAADALKDKCFFVCTKVNQGCFDYVFHYIERKAHHFIFFQCTVASKHDLKMRYVGDFLCQCFPNYLQAGTSTRSKSNNNLPMISLLKFIFI